MTRMTLLTLTLLAAVASPFAVAAMDGRMPKAERAAAVTPGDAPAAVARMPAAEPACVRRVRVVYAGYGEGTTLPCLTEDR